MSRSKIIVMMATVAIVVLVAAGCSRTPEQRASRMVDHLATELKLNDSQKATFNRIKDEFLAKRPDMIGLREESVREANALMRSAEIDTAKLNALTEKNMAQMNDMVKFVSAKFKEIHDMLTPEQREKLVSMIEKHMNKPLSTAEKKAPGDGY